MTTAAGPACLTTPMNRYGLTIAALTVIAVGCGGSDGVTQPAPEIEVAAPETDSGGSDPEAGGTGTAGGFVMDATGNITNPCAVLAEDQVAAATGLTVIGSEDLGNVGCRWFVERVDEDVLADDAISWQPFRAEQFAAQKDALDQGLQGEPIEGLGNDALFIGPGTLGEVWVLVDDLSFRVGNQFAGGNYDGRTAQLGLAQALVDALG